MFLCLLAYFASGAASLCAEVTWNRMLIVVVGNSLAATSMIVVVFMGGLGLGGYAGGKFLSRRRCSLLPYAVLEVLIALYILLSPILFNLLATVFSSLAQQWESPALLGLLRLAVTMVALLIPASLMGATFPAIMSGVQSRCPGNSHALLYGVNTVGAAVGCFVGGYHLVYELGAQATLWLAAGLGVAAVICVFAAARLSPSQACLQFDPDAEANNQSSGLQSLDINDPAVGGYSLLRLLAVSSFLLGFVALAYEVLVTRMVILFLNNLSSTFALALTGFLLGTGAGALLANLVHAANERRGCRGMPLFGAIALVSGILLVVTPYLIMAARYPLEALGIIVIPMVFLGSLLPFAIRTLHSNDRASAIKGTSILYAVNTVGGMLGAGIINSLLLPKIGLQGAVGLLFGICAAVAASCFFPFMTRNFRWIPLLLLPAVLPLLSLSVLPNLMNRYALKTAEWTGAPEVVIRLIHEGRAANVTVLDQNDPKQGKFRDMYLNGVEEASTRFYHAQLFKLLGMLPVALHEGDRQKNSLVIAFGAGITAGSVLASDSVSSLDVVDLNPDVEGINNLFREFNGDVYHAPRFRFHNNDGRNYLVTSGKKYDLIISDSTHPCSYDSWILYTSEFYRDVKQHLLPGGVFAQWVSVSEIMRGALFPIYLNTFRSVFPHATFWYVPGSNQALMLATPEPFMLDAARLQQRLDRLAPWFKGGEYQIDSVARVAGFFWLDESMMGRMIGAETRVNSDMRNYFEKSSMQAKIPPERQLPFFQADVTRYVRGGDERLLSEIRREQRTGWLLTRYGFYSDIGDLNQAYCLNPENNNVKYWMRFAYSGKIPTGLCH